MELVNCEAYTCTHNDNGKCELDEITVTMRGIDTDCGDYERRFDPDDVTIVYTYGKADDTVESQPFD